MESPKPKLGRLAQNARQKHLKSARNLLFLVAALQVLDGIILFFMFNNLRIPAEAMPMVYLSFGTVFGFALAFFILGLLVPKFPIPATVIALVLFITLHAIYAMADPTSLLSGWLLKIIVIVVLVKAIQAAVAYEKERKLEANSASD